jgi:hypothetical protein
MMLSRYFRSSYTFSDVRSIFLISLGVYTFLSFLLTGIYVHPIEQYLYLVNIAVILFLVPSISDNFEIIDEPPRRSLVACILSIVIIGVFALIAINSHGDIPGAGVRFK